jgi:PmbA protein
MLGKQHIKEILDRVLKKSTADETEVLFLGMEEALTRFANNEIHQNVAETNFGVVIRAAVGKRVAAVSTSDTSEAGLSRAVEQAEALARLQPENPDFPGFPPPTPLPDDVVSYDETTAGATPEFRARAVGDVIRYALDRDVVASGAFSTSRFEWGIANSYGLFAYAPTTLADFVTVAMTDTSSGYAAETAWQVESIDVSAHGRAAIDKALRAQHPQPVEPGEYPVVLEPYATMDMMAFLGRAASAMSVHEGRSWMSGRQGERLMAPAITLTDDPRDPAIWPLPFDFEGLPRQPVTIIDQGVAANAVYDYLWAKKTDHAPTGHALPAFNPFSPGQAIGGFGAMPLHLKLQTGESTLEEMIQGVERGIYVTRFNYTRPVHPREVVITGLTRDGAFWIENGEIAHPVRNLRFTQSYVAALNDVVAIGATAQTGRGYVEMCQAPALSLGNFRFTGTTEF